MQRRSFDDTAVTSSTHDQSLERNDDSFRGSRSRSAPRERLSARPAPAPTPALQLRALPGRPTAGRQVSLGSWDAFDETFVAAAAVAAAAAAAAAAASLDTAASLEGDLGYLPPPPPVPEVPFHFQGPGLSVRVRCYCIGVQMDRSELQDMVLRRLPSSSVRAYPGDVVVSNYFARSGLDPPDRAPGAGDIIFLCQLGCVVFWGLPKDAERHIISEIAEPCLVDGPLPSNRQERDRLKVLYTTAPRAAIQNDTLALHYRHAEDMEVKLAVSSALAQSTQLSVFEEEFRLLVKRLAAVPTALAESGEVPLGDKDVLMCIGELYTQMSSVNLIGAAMGVPEAVEAGRTAIRTLYRGVHDYLDIEERLGILNERFSITNELLELCRTLGHQVKLAMLDKVVVWLLIVSVVLALMQLAGFVGWKPSWRQ